METELKLALPREQVEAFCHHPLLLRLGAGAPETHRLVATYYDTPDLALLDYGIGLRVRQEGGRWMQTIKTAGDASAGLHRRHEWNAEIAGNAVDFSQIRDPELAAMFADPELRRQIRPLFATDVQRTLWRLLTADGTRIELALDQGEVRSPAAMLPLTELELELEAGDAGQLYQVALALTEQIPARIENASKAAKGYSLYRSLASQPRKATSLGLGPDLSVEQAFAVIIETCLADLAANEAAVLSSDDPEGVHQMRVTLRRLRAALGVFKPVVPRRAGPWREPLRSLADLLGSARDWDVFLEQGLGAIQTELPEYPGLRALQEHGEALRAGSYTALRAALGSPAHTRLLLGLGAWLCARGWRRHLSPSQQAELAAPLVPFAAEVLGQQALGLREQGSEFHSLDAVARHQLRITAKKLRYAGEFFAALFPGAETAPYLAGLSRLQDVLGDLNDADVAGRLLEELGIPPGQPGRCVADGWYACRTHLGRANAEVAWAAFRDLMPFWHPRPD